MPELLDQFRGCLLGGAVGDALGGPLDALQPEEIADRHGNVTEMIGGGRLMLTPGETTVNTEQMLCVLESYNEIGKFDPIDLADRLLEWYRVAPRAVGHLAREAMENLLYGYNFERAGRDAGTGLPENMRMDSGSLARAVPTGLVRYHDHVHLVGESRVASGITHFDERCKLACVCLNMGISHLLLAEPSGLLEDLTEWIEPRNTVLAYAIKAVQHIGPDELQTTGQVVDTLQAALWSAVHCTSFEEGLVLLVNKGRDAATVGAVSGALLGARFGVKGITKRWLERLKYRRQIDDGAKRLYQLSQREE